MKHLVVICFAAFAAASAANAACDSTVAPGKFSGLTVRLAGNAVIFAKKRLAVDADGAPNSYLVDGNGLSYTCDGLVAIVNGKRSTPDNDKSHWQKNCRDGWAAAKASGDYSKLDIFGFATDEHKVPLIQQDGDPLPGKGFISETTVAVSEGAIGTQRHWVDATKISYVVLSSSFVSTFDVNPGDVAAVYRPRNGRIAYAVYGDGGALGEGSVELHNALGNNPIIIDGRGMERAKSEIDGETILTVVFPGIATHPILDSSKWNAEIAAKGKQALDAWGGIERLNACLN